MAGATVGLVCAGGCVRLAVESLDGGFWLDPRPSVVAGVAQGTLPGQDPQRDQSLARAV